MKRQPDPKGILGGERSIRAYMLFAGRRDAGGTRAGAAGPRPRGRVHIEFDERGEVVAYELLQPDEEPRRIWRAMMLAPTLEVCSALLGGEAVPVERLDPEWVKRFGIKS